MIQRNPQKIKGLGIFRTGGTEHPQEERMRSNTAGSMEDEIRTSPALLQLATSGLNVDPATKTHRVGNAVPFKH